MRPTRPIRCARMIKYLGSKRVLLPRIAELAGALPDVRVAADVFTGTTRVAQAFKRMGMFVHANDMSTYAATFARTYVEADAASVDLERVASLLNEAEQLRPIDGYVTETFCRQARFFHPDNGRRIDAIRGWIADRYGAGSGSEPDTDIERAMLLTSLIEAADRVDSTTGVQMAYLKQWAARALQPMRLRVPELIAGRGRAWQLDAVDFARRVGAVDLAYLDPPYNQHSYLGNYHVWETLAAGDEPEAYGVARKRIDVRTRRSAWNSKRTAAHEMRELIGALDATWLLVSFNAEGHIDIDDIIDMLATRGDPVAAIGLPHRRYVGAQIGIHDLNGKRVGNIGHLHTTEWLLLAGPDALQHARAAMRDGDAVAARTVGGDGLEPPTLSV